VFRLLDCKSSALSINVGGCARGSIPSPLTISKGVKMYLIISEDGSFCRCDSINEVDVQSALDGFCEIINMFDFTYFTNGEWVKIEKG